MELRKITQKEFDEIYQLHLDFLESIGRIGVCANLAFVDLREIIFPREVDCKRHNDFRKTVFNYNLKGTYLQTANLEGACLTGLNLSGSDFTDTNLMDADMRYSNLKGADLRGADLSGADLSNAILDENSLSGAIIGSTTILDETLDRKLLKNSRLPINYYIEDFFMERTSDAKSEEYYKSLFEEDDNLKNK